MKKIILFSTISVLLSACGGGSGRDASFEHDPKPVVNSVKLSTGQTIQLRGTGVITSVDPNTTVNADADGTVLNNAIQGRTYAGGYATDTSYAYVEANNAGYTSVPKFEGHVTTDIPTTGKANYSGEVYTLRQFHNGNINNIAVDRSVNEGVAVGAARFEADFGTKTVTGGANVNISHGTYEYTDTIVVKKANGDLEDKEVTKVETIRGDTSYSLNNVSFNDLKAGTAPVNITHNTSVIARMDGKVLTPGSSIHSHNQLGNGGSQSMQGTASANFYGTNAKELVGALKTSNVSDNEYDAAFHTRKQ